MTTTITALSSGRLGVEAGSMRFICESREFNKHHNGVWNSRVMCFVPQSDTFSDGKPVADYDGYQDHSGTYFDECQVCGVATNGNRYCGASCEARDQGNVFGSGLQERLRKERSSIPAALTPYHGAENG